MPTRLSTILNRRTRESARRRRDRDLKVESLEPRLALATGLLSTLVQMHDQSGRNLLAPGATVEIQEGQELAASVSLKRRPDSAILVSFKGPAAALEAGVPPTTLRFTKDNWNVPQSVPLRSLQDNVRDGDQLVSVKMTTAVARNPQAQAARKIWIDSIDSKVVATATPATATYRGTAFGGGNSGTVVGTYDSVTKQGTATLSLTMPKLKNFIDRKINLNFFFIDQILVDIDWGVLGKQVVTNLTHRVVGLEQGLFGTVTVFDPRSGESATATISANAGVGIVTDGTTFTGGGFDGNGNAYSWQALGSSSALAWNGVTFDLANPNQPNFIWANGQTITVPQGNYNALNLAAAAINKSQQNQELTVSFTDGSTEVWTQSFSDWLLPQQNQGESIVSTQSYAATASGGTSALKPSVYAYTYAIPSGKTVASIMLPDNADLRILDLQMSSSTAVALPYNAFGIATTGLGAGLPNHEGFNGKGLYYNSNMLGSTIAWSGATFTLGPVPTSNKGVNNFAQARGQTIDVPQGTYGWLYLAGAGANGNQTNQQITLTFSDGSTATLTQSFSNWKGFITPETGQATIHWQTGLIGQMGQKKNVVNNVFGYAYQIPAGKTLSSITLPNNTNVGILAAAMA